MPRPPEHLPTTRLVWNTEVGEFQSVAQPDPSNGRFIKGPLPLAWFEGAAALPGRALHVALAIWFQVGLERSSTIKLGQKRASQFSVSRDAKYDALKRMTEAGLIEVEQSPGQAPRVTVVHPPSQRPR
jgi:hypothetical protein